MHTGTNNLTSRCAEELSKELCRRRERERVFCGSVPMVFFHTSVKANRKTRQQFPFNPKTQGFVGNTVRLHAFITPTDMKHEGAHSVSDPEGCFDQVIG